MRHTVPDPHRNEGLGWPGSISSVLTYHEISPQPSKYVYSASCRQFEEHLELLLELNSAKGTTLEVTFDDGKLSDHEFALPLLDKHGVRAKFFVSVGLIGNDVRHMNWDQVRQLASSGHSVQSHGWSHLLLNRATPNELGQELEWSKKTLEDRLGLPVTSVSLPGGRWNADVLKACARTGYTRVYHSDPWKPVMRREDLEFVGRLMVRNTLSAERMRRLLLRKSGDLLYLWTQHQMKEALKRLLGDDRYQHLWSSVGRLARMADAKQ